MTEVQNKSITRRFFEAFESNDQAALKQILASNLVFHHDGAPEPESRESFLQVVGNFKAAFSDQHYTIEDQIAEGDKVVTRATWRALHAGEFQGIPATGNQVSMSGIAIDRIEDGKIVERWLNHDLLGLMQQLGAIPTPQPVS